jgi:lipase chaperone LimK
VSLAGTEEDGALRVDDAGDLIVEPAVLRLFDYYLSATGEESPAALRARIVAAIQRRHLGARGEGQAVALLDTYLGYREAARGLRAPGDDPEARLTALQDLRRRSFGADTAAKLFGREEQMLSGALERRRLLADRTLPEADRATRLARLEADLPPDVQRARAEATRPLRERADEEAMRASGATDDDIRAVRVAAYGEEAADRLAALDAQRAEWRRRLDAFRDARAAALQAEGDPARREAAVQAILDASFTPLEQIRVRASGALGGP